MTFKSSRPVFGSVSDTNKSKREVNGHMPLPVHISKDYDKFGFFAENRPINMQHVNNLAKDLLQNNFLRKDPIKVTKDYKIIEGQHRFLAAKRVGAEVYYIIDEDDLDPLDTMLTANTNQRSWTAKDFVHHLAQRGNKDFQVIQKMQKLYNLPISVLVTFTGNKVTLKGASIRDRIQKDSFALGDAEEFENICEYFYNFLEILRKFSARSLVFLKNVKSAKAFKLLYETANFDKDLFLKQADRAPHLIKQQITLDDYLKMFLAVYNFKQQTKKLKMIDVTQDIDGGADE